MRLGLCVVFTLSLFGCSKDKEKGNAANASLTFANGTSLHLFDATSDSCPDLGGGFTGEACFDPTSYAIKLMSVIVSPDAQGAQSAPAGLIWVNPGCGKKTSQTVIDDKEFSYDSPADDCTDDKVSNFFELARPTAAVNADLNSQPHQILPGTYNYVQLGFCQGAAKSKNAKFRGPGMPEAAEVTFSTCGITSAKAEPPIVVGEGESITVSLTYDLTGAVFSQASYAGQEHCYTSEDGTVVRCLGGMKLVPGFAKK